MSASPSTCFWLPAASAAWCLQIKYFWGLTPAMTWKPKSKEGPTQKNLASDMGPKCTENARYLDVFGREAYKCTNHTTTVQKAPCYWPLCNLLNQSPIFFGRDADGPTMAFLLTTSSVMGLVEQHFPLAILVDSLETIPRWATSHNQRHTDLGIPRLMPVLGGAMAGTGSLMASQNKELWEKAEAFTSELVRSRNHFERCSV